MKLTKLKIKLQKLKIKLHVKMVKLEKLTLYSPHSCKNLIKRNEKTIKK